MKTKNRIKIFKRFVSKSDQIIDNIDVISKSFYNPAPISENQLNGICLENKENIRLKS